MRSIRNGFQLIRPKLKSRASRDFQDWVTGFHQGLINVQRSQLNRHRFAVTIGEKPIWVDICKGGHIGMFPSGRSMFLLSQRSFG
jgi:hypothetical protein